MYINTRANMVVSKALIGVAIVAILILLGVLFYIYEKESGHGSVSRMMGLVRAPAKTTGLVWDQETGTLHWTATPDTQLYIVSLQDSKGKLIHGKPRITTGTSMTFFEADGKHLHPYDVYRIGIVGKNGVGMGVGTTLTLNGCPDNKRYIYGDLNGGIYCCDDLESAKRGDCNTPVCCAKMGLSKGCQGNISCPGPGMPCPGDKPYMYGNIKDGFFCCATDPKDKGGCDTKPCCVEGGEKGCQGLPICKTD